MEIPIPCEKCDNRIIRYNGKEFSYICSIDKRPVTLSVKYCKQYKGE